MPASAPPSKCWRGRPLAKVNPVQYLRDVRITAIYEGTNGIQAMDLVGRKLSDGGEAAFRLIQEEFAAHGLSVTVEALKPLFIGHTIAETAVYARAEGAALPEDWPERFYERLCARLAEGTALMPGVPELLDRLDAAGVPYAVGSNGRRIKMEATLGQHPEIWARLKDRLFSGQDLGCPKPAPELYLIAARSLGAAPERWDEIAGRFFLTGPGGRHA